jgi:HEAT repeat protein
MAKESSKDFIARMAELKRLSSRDLDSRLRQNKVASEPVLRELQTAGFDVARIADLRHFVRDYTAAIPVLVKWLAVVENSAVKSDIVRCLSLPTQKRLAPFLIEEYRRASSDTLEQRDFRVAVANGLEILADDAIFDAIVELSQDKQGGPSRVLLVLALGKMTNPSAVQVLTSLLDDPEVRVAAITALGKLRASDAREKLLTFLNSDDAEVVSAAKSALSRLGKGRPARQQIVK